MYVVSFVYYIFLREHTWGCFSLFEFIKICLESSVLFGKHFYRAGTRHPKVKFSTQRSLLHRDKGQGIRNKKMTREKGERNLMGEERDICWGSGLGKGLLLDRKETEKMPVYKDKRGNPVLG